MFLASLVLSAALFQTAPAVKNPSVIAFDCVDHAQDTQHEVDIIRASDNAVVQTLLIGDPAPNAQGVIEANVNVQPVAFGQYRFVVRAVAGTAKSDNSLPSAIWERAPGRPTNVTAK